MSLTSPPSLNFQTVIGTAAEAELIAALDVDVRADGHGLPAGTGNYEAGAVLFSQICVDCHG